MHIKIFDCDIFIDSHKISISDHSGESSYNSFNKKPLDTCVIKEIIEEHLLFKTSKRFNDLITQGEGLIA